MEARPASILSGEIFGVIQFYKAANAEQVCGTHGIGFSVPRIQQNIKGFDIQFRTQSDEFMIGGCNAADPLLASAFFKRKMNASQFGGLLECMASATWVTIEASFKLSMNFSV